MKNRAVIILALLAANHRFGRPEIQRTVLVKQAFLAETIRPLYHQWRRIFSFYRYHYGPYDEDIFYRLDVLIFNGLAEITSAERRGGNLEVRYRITDAGLNVVRRIEFRPIIELTEDIVWALQTLGIDQANSICKLVYQESEFARIFKEQVKAGIGPGAKPALPSVTSANNQTFLTLSIINALRHRHYKRQNGSNLMPLREIVSIFLKTLAQQYSQ